MFRSSAVQRFSNPENFTPLTIVIATAVKEEVSRANPKCSLHDSCLVVIPALNEEETVTNVVGELSRRGFSRIRVIDNGSTDATASRARAAGAEVLTEPGVDMDKHAGADYQTFLPV